MINRGYMSQYMINILQPGDISAFGSFGLTRWRLWVLEHKQTVDLLVLAVSMVTENTVLQGLIKTWTWAEFPSHTHTHTPVSDSWYSVRFGKQAVWVCLHWQSKMMELVWCLQVRHTPLAYQGAGVQRMDGMSVPHTDVLSFLILCIQHKVKVII